MSDVTARLRAGLADRYTIERDIGRGGMAIVYLAYDHRHSRFVAIKALHPELAASVGAERFLREIEIAARLQHPYILPVYDSGEVDRLLYYVMPHVQGSSLRNRLKLEKQLQVEDAVCITQEVASALSYAHSRGVIHRDIKPENILLSDGHAVVADFGIARAIGSMSGATITQSGLTVGTPAYISPEQGSGDTELDGRSDIYSLGCVLYEMLAGHPPFHGLPAQATIVRHMTATPTELTTLREGVPTAVLRAVSKALLKEPDERFADATAFTRALTTAEAIQPPKPGERMGLTPPPSIAVLRFVNMSPDKEAEYFSDGMTEELISALTRIEGLRVASRTSTFALAKEDLDIREIGERLNVGTVLEGSVRQAANRLRVTAQLVNVSDGYHIWAETYDRELKDVFAVQDEISQSIVTALKVKLVGEAAKPLVTRYTDNVEAYTLYLKGRYFWNKRTAEGFKKGIEQFERAIQLDHDYALAYAGLADSYSLLGWYRYLSSQEAFAQTKRAAERAVQIDDSLAEAYTSLAYAKFLYDWDWDGAERDFERAVACNPDYPTVRHWYGEFMMAMGRFDEAIEQLNQGQTLDPLSLVITIGAGWAYYFSGQYDEAIEQYRKALELDPNFFILPWFLGPAYVQNGMYDHAIALYQDRIRRSGSHAGLVALLTQAYALAGEGEEARHAYSRLEERAQEEPIPKDYLALASTALGETNQAFKWLQGALDERCWSLAFLKVDPAFERLRPDRRFRALLKRIRLE